MRLHEFRPDSPGLGQALVGMEVASSVREDGVRHDQNQDTKCERSDEPRRHDR